MDRAIDDARAQDAKILASLRRRSSASNPKEEKVLNASSRPEDRAEALRRLVSSNAAKEPTGALSALSSTLRRELGDASAFSSENATEDPTLDLVEAELTAAAKGDEDATPLAPESEATTEPAPIPESPRRVEVDEPVPSVVVPAPSVATEAAKSRDVDAPDLLVVSELRKGYVMGKKLIPVLQGVNLSVRKGELLAIVGQSGSGKSTLLHLMGTLDIPDSGTIHFDGQRIDNLPTSQRDVLRNRFIGMIFQFYHLIPEMTTLENVLAPLMIRDSILGYWSKRAKYVERAKELLDMVGLSHRLKHKPNELSGGEMQRASIARALITNPRVLLADEPTGNLDSKASLGVLDLLRRLNREKNLTIVMVTHDMSQARDADRAVRIVDGWIEPEAARI